jgi:hypothetical protein
MTSGFSLDREREREERETGERREGDREKERSPQGCWWSGESPLSLCGYDCGYFTICPLVLVVRYTWMCGAILGDNLRP